MSAVSASSSSPSSPDHQLCYLKRSKLWELCVQASLVSEDESTNTATCAVLKAKLYLNKYAAIRHNAEATSSFAELVDQQNSALLEKLQTCVPAEEHNEIANMKKHELLALLAQGLYGDHMDQDGPPPPQVGPPTVQPQADATVSPVPVGSPVPTSSLAKDQPCYLGKSMLMQLCYRKNLIRPEESLARITPALLKSRLYLDQYANIRDDPDAEVAFASLMNYQNSDLLKELRRSLPVEATDHLAKMKKHEMLAELATIAGTIAAKGTGNVPSDPTQAGDEPAPLADHAARLNVAEPPTPQPHDVSSTRNEPKDSSENGVSEEATTAAASLVQEGEAVGDEASAGHIASIRAFQGALAEDMELPRQHRPKRRYDSQSASSSSQRRQHRNKKIRAPGDPCGVRGGSEASVHDRLSQQIGAQVLGLLAQSAEVRNFVIGHVNKAGDGGLALGEKAELEEELKQAREQLDIAHAEKMALEDEVDDLREEFHHDLEREKAAHLKAVQAKRSAKIAFLQVANELRLTQTASVAVLDQLVDKINAIDDANA